MLFFLQNGHRVVASDRRGHGRWTQTRDGHDMDHYADDLATPGGLPKSVFDDLQARQPVGVLPSAPVRPLLWLQPARSEILRGDHRELVAPGHDGRSQGPLPRATEAPTIYADLLAWLRS
jgi:hypothetical protein